jgi:hypothetical protein
VGRHADSKRAHHRRISCSRSSPIQSSPAPGWQPRLFDYRYVSFTNSIAFSPTDSMPLTHAAKGLMLTEASISSMTVLLVVARAVNIFT